MGYADGIYTLKLKDGADINVMTDKFSAGLKISDTLMMTKSVNLNIKMGSSKLKQSVKAVTLSAKDGYSIGIVKISALEDGLTDIKEVRFISPKDSTGRDQFLVTSLGNGEYSIGYNGRNPALAKSGTVKLLVF